MAEYIDDIQDTFNCDLFNGDIQNSYREEISEDIVQYKLDREIQIQQLNFLFRTTQGKVTSLEYPASSMPIPPGSYSVSSTSSRSRN